VTWRRLLLTLSALALLATACGTSTASSPAIPAPVQAAPVIPGGAQQVPDTPGGSSPNQNCNSSLRPQGPLPTPDHMPAASYMAAIHDRPGPNGGYLKVGVDQNTLLWGYRNAKNDLAGFDIDMVGQVAQAIFGSNWQKHIQYVIVRNADRITAVTSGRVDIVAETMTITCSRQRPAPNQKPDGTACCVDFSTEYYDAAQRILVPIGSSIQSVGDLSGKRVCAAKASTSLVNLSREAPGATKIAVVNQTDCLVLLQQGQIDAISTDDTILQGLAVQDPNLALAKLRPGAHNDPRYCPGDASDPYVCLSNEPYGMAISTDHRDFTAFVNAVLEHERTDATPTTPSTWAQIWLNNLGPLFHSKVAPPPPPATYRD
jgi:polar amino acid transport system substrate-binding protein